MKLFYFCMGAAFAFVIKMNLDRRRALRGAPPRRVPADRHLDTAEDEVVGPLSEV